ncbi:hypothetical protein CAEBREN_18668 [Caenorhabditis brenneri]|uniref:Uncharacterized protein n=1 Tax=Caenorhabditis brenneri TaxID=135651 RepID=G0MQP7_CAEBE|nr:hypothetical protein CAEBREN_18668 [Caenorhabditis brenneri]
MILICNRFLHVFSSSSISSPLKQFFQPYLLVMNESPQLKFCNRAVILYNSSMKPSTMENEHSDLFISRVCEELFC